MCLINAGFVIWHTHRLVNCLRRRKLITMVVDNISNMDIQGEEMERMVQELTTKY